MMVNWEFMDNMTPESATQLVDDLRSGAEVPPPAARGSCTWREAERVLAGFPDGLADEGPAAGPASLVGLEHRPRERLDGARRPSRRPRPASTDAAGRGRAVEAAEQATRVETETNAERGSQ